MPKQTTLLRLENGSGFFNPVLRLDDNIATLEPHCKNIARPLSAAPPARQLIFEPAPCARKCDPLPIRRPRGMRIIARNIRESFQASAVGPYGIELPVPVAFACENDPIPLRRPCRKVAVGST